MRLELEILDGPHKGQHIVLRNGLKLGHSQGTLSFNDLEMRELHAVVSVDSKKLWNIQCLDGAKMRLGFEEVAQAKLISGLIFHLGQTGFKVVERQSQLPQPPWKEALADWIEGNPGQPVQSEIFFFLRPVRLFFVQGPQYEELYILSYGPRELGYNSLDISLKDPSSPERVARFFQIGDQVYIENLCGDLALINQKNFDQHLIVNGDVLRVGSSVIELSTLE